MDKSPDAYRTISEVADELGLPQHVLRFWETRFPQIKPLKRGGGRRFYRPDDIDLVRGIQTLLYSEGYTIKGVQRILKEDGVKPVQMVGRGSTFVGEHVSDAAQDDDLSGPTEFGDSATADDAIEAPDQGRRFDNPMMRQDPPLAREASTSQDLHAVSASQNRSVPSVSGDRIREQSRTPRASTLAPEEALQIAVSELQECARLLGLMRDKT